MPITNNNSNKLVEDTLSKASSYLADGDFKQALSIFLKAIEAYPNNIEINYQIAKVYFLMEKEHEALKKLNHLLNLSPKYHKAYYFMAKVYFYLIGENDKACSCIIKAIQLNPGYSYYHSLAAQVYICIGEKDKAFSYSDKALDLDKHNYEANLIKGLYWLEAKEYEKSFSFFSKAYSFNPNELGYESDFCFMLNKNFIDSIKHPKALLLAEQAYKLYPNNNYYKWLYDYTFLQKNFLNKPIVFFENLDISLKTLYPLIGLALLIIFVMYFSETLSITLIGMFKWICSLLFLIFIPYQFFVYILLTGYLLLYKHKQITS